METFIYLDGFNAAHTLAYSLVALQEMNLAYHYPLIFWDTANLIVDSGAMNLEEEVFSNEEEDEDGEDNKLKNSSSDYGKIASAIGKMQSRGLKFSLPDINKSDITYTPVIETNGILYGLRGITRVGNQLIKEIIEKRPYASIEDFLNKIKINKLQMISLLKSGAFDNLCGDRKKAMDDYLDLITDKKKRITLQNMQMLIKYKLIPQEYRLQIGIFNFNKYLKRNQTGIFYNLDSVAMNFFSEYFDTSLLNSIKIDGENSSGMIHQKTWDNLYKKSMDPIRDWMKKNQQKILNELNNTLLAETAEKYTEGSISKWEMDSLSFYYHEHELQALRKDIYEIDNYFSLPDEPEVERVFHTKDNKEIMMYKLSRIAGTVIDKDKNKNMITLLTPDGVVTVKIWKSQFAAWDRQLSEKTPDGKKHVVEKSWFTRGTKLIITGIKRENTFVPKKYKSTEWPLFEKIIELDDKGFVIESQTERQEVD